MSNLISERYKLAQARFFLDEMKKQKVKDDHLHFCYYTDAFLSASRSVMQLIHKKAERQGRREWWQQLAERSTWCKVFKDIRDVSVHAEPFSPPVRGFVTIPAGALRIDLSKIGRGSVRLVSSKDPKDHEARVEDPPEEPPTQVMNGPVQETEEPQGNEILKIESRYSVEVGGKALDLIACCESYLEELSFNIETAEQEGIS